MKKNMDAKTVKRLDLAYVSSEEENVEKKPKKAGWGGFMSKVTMLSPPKGGAQSPRASPKKTLGDS